MKIGLFFGSFNPIHIGHMAIANYIVEYSLMDQIWFVVTPHNPLKNRNNLLDDYQRLELVHRAIDTDFRFRASDIEFRLPRPNFTVDTLAFLKEKHPKNDFHLIIGADNYITLRKWKNSDYLIKNYKFLIYPRPGFDHEAVTFGANFKIIHAPNIEVSSTFIRNAIRDGKNVCHFMPPKAYEYIEEMGFYQ